MNKEAVARVAHEVNRAYCMSMGDASQPAWEDAPEWQRASAVAGVEFHHANPDAGPEASHESWFAQKAADGWVYGPVKAAEGKTHPCMVPFGELPAAQQAKDFLFRAVVHALPSAPEPQPFGPPRPLDLINDGMAMIQAGLSQAAGGGAEHPMIQDARTHLNAAAARIEAFTGAPS